MANNPDDEEHTTFWLVVADQFVKRAIVCDRVREKAVGIIDTGSDIAVLSKLGMKPQDLRKRQKMLSDLRARLAASSEVAKPRPVLKKPQAFLMEVGEVFVGECINSDFASKEKIPGGWTQNGWGAVIIVERKRAFDFLAWYRPLTISYARSEKPSLVQLSSEPLWVLKRPGTCSTVHFKRLELEKIGAVPMDADKLVRSFPAMPSGKPYAVNDISLANALRIGPELPAALMPIPGEPPDFSRGRPDPTIASLDEILSDSSNIRAC